MKERSVKLIRKQKRQPPAEVASEAGDRKIWTNEVKSWVAKFQQQRRTIESLQQFNSLFKSSPA